MFWKRSTLFALTIAFTCIVTVVFWLSKGIIWDNLYNTISNALTLASLLMLLYHRWDRMFLFLSRYWIILTNKGANWRCSAEYEGEFGNEVMLRVKEHLLQYNASRILMEKTDSIHCRFDGLFAEFNYSEILNDDGEVVGRISIQFDDVSTPYDKTEAKLEGTLVPLFEFIERSISGNLTTKYTFSVRFSGEVNPFIKNSLAHLSTKKVVGFQCELATVENNNTTPSVVRIGKNGLEINTTSLRRFHDLSVDYLGVTGD